MDPASAVIIAAFVGLVASAIGGLVAGNLTLKAAREQRTADRKLARDDRIWEHLIGVGGEFLSLGYELQAALLTLGPDADQEAIAQKRVEWTLLGERLRLVLDHETAAVVDSLTRRMFTAQDLRFNVETPRGEAGRELHEVFTLLDQLRDSLNATVRDQPLLGEGEVLPEINDRPGDDTARLEDAEEPRSIPPHSGWD